MPRAHSYRLTIEPTSVRDLAIPLGAFANVVVQLRAPRLPGAVGVRRQVRSSPPVLLPRRGEVGLPGPGCARDFELPSFSSDDGAIAEALLSALAAEPLLIELWHHDKYTRDVLLGVASVDLSEVLSARPAADGVRSMQRQEQTVPVVERMEATGRGPEAAAET